MNFPLAVDVIKLKFLALFILDPNSKTTLQNAPK